MRKISADIVFPIAGEPVKEGVVIVDHKGEIQKIDQRVNHDSASLEIHKGVIVPGFINTHCHLELSHMKGKVDTGTGLLPFLHSVVAFRDFPQDVILDAIDQADQKMYEGGIVAVGDISNKLDTADRKAKSSIRYYTFVEMFDFLQDGLTDQLTEQYDEVYMGQSNANGNRKSAVPHAPYTVSPSLFQKINRINSNKDITVSIHNQETVHEDELFLSKTGGFVDFYQSFNFSLDHFKATDKTSIHYAMEHMNAGCRTLFVHNTLTSPEDIQAAQAWNSQVYWATCANANLYIENRLPNYKHFIDTGAKMTIGTDSLTSNWQLSIIEEMKTIVRYQSYVPFETLIRWATLNGAEALGFDDTLGSIEPGKTPGLNLLNLEPDLKIEKETTVKRLI